MELVYLLFKELMKRGWKVYGEYDELMSYGQTRGKRDFGFGVLGEVKFSLRELVSKESGLWQFVCDSKLIEQGKTVHDFVMKHICYADENRCGGFSMCNAEYYIMMCSLLDESELEQFLLDNIKVDG